MYDISSSHVKGFSSAPLYRNPWPNMQCLTGLAISHAGWCQTSLHGPVRNVVSMMMYIVHWSALNRCQINLRLTIKYLTYCYRFLVRVNPSFPQIWTGTALLFLSITHSLIGQNQKGHNSFKMSNLRVLQSAADQKLLTWEDGHILTCFFKVYNDLMSVNLIFVWR